MKWCVVIPTYNNGKTLEKVLSDVLQITPDVIAVNDGSTDDTLRILEKFPAVKIITYSRNMGKGYALQKGFRQALEDGFTHVVTIDSDGQHYASDIPAIVEKSEENPEALIVGTRTLPEEKLRRGSGFANKFSNFWFRFISGASLPDTQSGFRLYPLEPIRNIRFYSGKYEFELEVLIRSAWRGVSLMNIPIDVFYPEKKDRVSHFRPFRDFVRISVLNMICFLLAVLYVKPFSFLKFLKKENIRDFLKKNVLQTGESAEKLTLSVMLGVFMGIVPIWGAQLITAIALAYLLRLNKVVVIVAANISIPPLIPVILYLSYITGGIILSAESQLAYSADIAPAWIGDIGYQYVIGAVVFAAVSAIIAGLITFVFLKVLRKKTALIKQ